MSKTGEKVYQSDRTLLQRLNRKFSEVDGSSWTVKKARGGVARQVGPYYVIDREGEVVQKNIDLEKWAKQHKCLFPWEGFHRRFPRLPEKSVESVMPEALNPLYGSNEAFKRAIHELIKDRTLYDSRALHSALAAAYREGTKEARRQVIRSHRAGI